MNTSHTARYETISGNRTQNAELSERLRVMAETAFVPDSVSHPPRFPIPISISTTETETSVKTVVTFTGEQIKEIIRVLLIENYPSFQTLDNKSISIERDYNISCDTFNYTAIGTKEKIERA